MKFSVVIPLYNKEKHIERAIISVLAQTYQNFEIIVVDDGSTDDGLQIVESMINSRIKVIKKKNEGVSSARNKGIECASNHYIGFLDADDSWKPTYLESIFNLIGKHPDAGLYATAYESIGIEAKGTSANSNMDLAKGESGLVDYFKNALKAPFIQSSSVVIPKHVFKHLGSFSLDLTRGEDLDMWCRIALNYQIAYLNKSLTCYFLDAENRAMQKKRVYSKSFISVAEELLEEQKKNGNTSVYFEEYMINIIISKARYLIEEKRDKEARKLLYEYKHTNYNKKTWFKTYLLSFKLVYFIYKSIRK